MKECLVTAESTVLVKLRMDKIILILPSNISNAGICRKYLCLLMGDA